MYELTVDENAYDANITTEYRRHGHIVARWWVADKRLDGSILGIGTRLGLDQG